MTPPNAPTASVGEQLAQQFHETYERLAPAFGYETREASAKPWADVPDKNKRLMIAVCAEILASSTSLAVAFEAASATVRLAEAERALLAARREVRALETALVDRAASGAEIERAVKTFRSLENQRSDFAAMVEVLDEYERNRRTREARPNATRPFPWRAVVNAPDDAQVVCGEHGNPSTFAQIAECHTAADAEFIVEACNAAALAARRGETTAECQNVVIEGALAILGATTVDLESEAQRVVDELAAARRGNDAIAAEVERLRKIYNDSTTFVAELRAALAAAQGEK